MMKIFSHLIIKYFSTTQNKFYWFIDIPLVYTIRLFHKIFQQQKKKYLEITFKQQVCLSDDEYRAIRSVLIRPDESMHTNWKMRLANRQGRNFIFSGLIKASVGNVLELGRDRGRTLAQGLSGEGKDTDKRTFVSVDPVHLNVLDEDFVSPLCRVKDYGTYYALEQKELPDHYLDYFKTPYSQMIKTVRGFSFEPEVVEYCRQCAPFSVMLFDAYWKEDDEQKWGTNFYKVTKDFELYGPLIEEDGFLIITNAFLKSFSIHRFVEDLHSWIQKEDFNFCPVRIDRGLFCDENSLLLKKIRK